MKCANCGAKLADNASYCETCGGDAIEEAGVGGFARRDDSAESKPAPHEVRGFWYSAYVVLGILANAYGAYKNLFDEASLRAFVPTAPDWYFPVGGFGALAGVLLFIALWDLLKWGVIGLLGVSVVSAVMGWAIGLSAVWIFLGTVPGIAILLAFTLPKWKYMRWSPRRD
jgi:hypothetical protein